MFLMFLVIFLSFGPQRREYSVFDQALMDILLCRLPEFVNFARFDAVHT